MHTKSSLKHRPGKRYCRCCKRDHSITRWKKTDEYHKICQYCKEWFNPNHGKQVYCKGTCRTNAYRVRKFGSLEGWQKKYGRKYSKKWRKHNLTTDRQKEYRVRHEIKKFGSQKEANKYYHEKKKFLV